MSKYTFYGVGARAQVQIIDLTGEDVSPAIRKDKISVYAYILRATAHKSTAFSMVGEQIYGGHNLDECLTVVKSKLKLHIMEIPKSFKRYLNGSFKSGSMN